MTRLDDIGVSRELQGEDTIAGVGSAPERRVNVVKGMPTS